MLALALVVVEVVVLPLVSLVLLEARSVLLRSLLFMLLLSVPPIVEGPLLRPLMLLLLFGSLWGGGGGGDYSVIAVTPSAFSAAADPLHLGAEAALASTGGDGRFMATQPHLAVEPGVVFLLLLPLWAYKAAAVANGQRLMYSLDLTIAMATAAAIKTVLLG